MWKESTEVRKSQNKGKESENSYQKLKRSPRWFLYIYMLLLIFLERSCNQGLKLSLESKKFGVNPSSGNNFLIGIDRNHNIGSEFTNTFQLVHNKLYGVQSLEFQMCIHKGSPIIPILNSIRSSSHIDPTSLRPILYCLPIYA